MLDGWLLQVKTGVPAEQALMTLVPEAYRNHPDLVKNYPEVCLAALAAPCQCWHGWTLYYCRL
jgi:hypothetical protein